jgi:hypothetical protein
MSISPWTGNRRRFAIALATSLCPTLVAAQADTTRPGAAAPAGPPVRRISTATAVSTEELGSITSVLELRDGRVLLNDGTRRRLLLMDTTLKTVDVVLDSLAEISNTYGTRAGTLIPYRADSILFIDPGAFAVLVLDPSARVTRVRSIWRPDDMGYYMSPAVAQGNVTTPATDARGRVVYRINATPTPPKVAPPAGVPYIPSPPDSAFIVGIDIDTRKVDTLGVVHMPKVQYQIRQSADGFFSISVLTNPMPVTDDWAVLPTGVVAFVRGRDYRIDYRQADGTLSSSPKLAYPWQHLDEADKQKFIDSVKDANRRTQMGAYMAQMIRWVNVYEKPYPKDFQAPQGFVPQNGLQKDWKLPPGVSFPANYIYACAPGEEPKIIPQASAPSGAAGPPGAVAPPAGERAVMPMPGMPPGGPAGTPSCIPSPIILSGGVAPPPPTIRELATIPPDELPDYRPPFVAGSSRADADGNIWVHTTPPKPVPGGLIYDLINSQGEMIDRLQLPPGYTLVGFGKGKVVYLSMRDAKGIHLARVRLK